MTKGVKPREISVWLCGTLVLSVTVQVTVIAVVSPGATNIISTFSPAQIKFCNKSDKKTFVGIAAVLLLLVVLLRLVVVLLVVVVVVGCGGDVVLGVKTSLI